MKRNRVAVLGAGIMGTCTAMFLARRGFEVTLFDESDAPLARASRWNEGKIHLGHLYSADESLKTARRVLPGGLAFRRLIEELIGEPLPPEAVAVGDNYLVHRDSVVDAESTARYMNAVAQMASEAAAAGDYFTDLSPDRTRRLTPAQLAGMADAETVVAGFAVPECSVQANWVADRLIAVLASEQNIEARMGTRVAGVEAREKDGRWRVIGDEGGSVFDLVVNSLWQGRLAVDRSAGLELEPSWSHRFRLCLFIRTSKDIDVPCTVICTGPFGDIKNYNGRDFYLSWYPVGLVAESGAVEPTRPPRLDPVAREELISKTVAGLAETLPQANRIFAAAQGIDVEGGFVFALGTGSLQDPDASLHRRDRFGVRRRGTYVSVDTGKYSTAPWLAERIARDIAAG